MTFSKLWFWVSTLVFGGVYKLASFDEKLSLIEVCYGSSLLMDTYYRSGRPTLVHNTGQILASWSITSGWWFHALYYVPLPIRSMYGIWIPTFNITRWWQLKDFFKFSPLKNWGRWENPILTSISLKKGVGWSTTNQMKNRNCFEGTLFIFTFMIFIVESLRPMVEGSLTSRSPPKQIHNQIRKP